MNETIKKLLFISDQICEIYEELYNLSITNQEKSERYEKIFEFYENYLSQETTLLDSLNYNELITILKQLFEYSSLDAAISRCYDTIRYYFLKKYPNEKAIIYEIEGITLEEPNLSTEDDDEEADDDLEEEDGFIEIEYEDESDVARYANYVVLRTEINVIKSMYNRIVNTETDNKIDSKYKKALLKELKGFKCDFFFRNRDTEQLGIKYHLNIDALPNLPQINENTSSIYFNECLDILDDLYLMPSNERDTYTILEILFNMLCFDEYIKALTPEQIDRLIDACHQIEATISKSYFGNVGLQKLVRMKKN